MRVSLRAVMRLFRVLVILPVGGAALAADTEADFRAAYAVADATEREAGRLRNQWIATEAALAEAKAAAKKGDFNRARVAAKEAEALAKASIFQATSEKAAWKNLEIR